MFRKPRTSDLEPSSVSPIPRLTFHLTLLPTPAPTIPHSPFIIPNAFPRLTLHISPFIPLTPYPFTPDRTPSPIPPFTHVSRESRDTLVERA